MAQFQRKPIETQTPEYIANRARQGVDIRSEYMILRHRAEQRIRDLEKAGMGNYEAVRDYKNRFPTMKEIGAKGREDKALLYDALSEVRQFLNMKASTPGGIRAGIRQAQKTFEQHYGYGTRDNLPPMPPALFGEMMRSIKDSANAQSYYRNWKKAYRAILSTADRKGLNLNDLAEAAKNGEINIGVKGGISDARTGRSISRNWSRMG